jgi:hypothetical protein
VKVLTTYGTTYGRQVGRKQVDRPGGWRATPSSREGQRESALGRERGSRVQAGGREVGGWRLEAG